MKKSPKNDKILVQQQRLHSIDPSIVSLMPMSTKVASHHYLFENPHMKQLSKVVPQQKYSPNSKEAVVLKRG